MDRAYRYTFSEECILTLFGRGGFQAAHVPALHLALVHSPDASLALRVRRAWRWRIGKGPTSTDQGPAG